MFLRVRSLYGIVASTALIGAVVTSGKGTLPFPVPEKVEIAEATVVTNNDVQPLPKAGFNAGKRSLAEYRYIQSRANKVIELPKKEENIDAASSGVSTENAEYVARLIETEAGGIEQKDGRVAVGLTVLNRVESDEYPDTIRTVVEQPYQYATPSKHYSEESYDAAVTAITLWEEGDIETVLPEDCMYFFGYKKQNWFYRKASGGGVEFCPLEGQTITTDVIEAYQRIVLGKKSSQKASVVTETESTEIVEEEIPTDETVETVEEAAVAEEEIQESTGENLEEELIISEEVTTQEIEASSEGIATEEETDVTAEVMLETPTDI